MENDEQAVWIALTDEQVREVSRRIDRSAGLEGWFSELGEFERVRALVEPLLGDRRYSGPTLRVLLVLAAFPADGSHRSVTEVAHDAGVAVSSAHRIVSALVAVGLLRQDPRSRDYARPTKPARGDRKADG